MSNRIITISRQFGSGGRTIGKNTAERLGIPCYDHELITKLAEESGYAEDFIAISAEYSNYNGWLAYSLAHSNNMDRTPQDELWALQCRLIKDLAQKGPCVIVGRCADYILQDKEDIDLLKVFIYSDLEKRAERIVKMYGESDVAPEKRLRDKDKRRAAYYNCYTDLKWGKPDNYDLCLNSGAIGIDKCVDILTQLY